MAPNQDYVGYPWYDRLLRLSDVRFEIEQDGIVIGLEQWHEERFRGQSIIGAGFCLKVETPVQSGF